jgi:hypothetical protein
MWRLLISRQAAQRHNVYLTFGVILGLLHPLVAGKADAQKAHFEPREDEEEGHVRYGPPYQTQALTGMTMSSKATHAPTMVRSTAVKTLHRCF